MSAEIQLFQDDNYMQMIHSDLVSTGIFYS